MQTSKIIQLALCLFFITISCKKNDPNKNLTQNKQETQISNTNVNTTNDNSFVLSCGSGCAMIYTAESIKQTDKTINVKFKIETYINEQLSETSNEKYNFIYNSSGEIEKIFHEGENDDLLQNLMPDGQEEFRRFSKTLLKNKNVDISKFSKSAQVDTNSNIKFNTLPFDFENYYNICVDENNQNCETKYPSYNYSENKNILEGYGIKEQPSSFFLLPKIKNFQPLILAFTDSDIEGYYLKIIDKNKVISSLQIGKMDGEIIEDFIIKENYEIEVYSRKDSTEKRVLKKKYKILENGLIK